MVKILIIEDDDTDFEEIKRLIEKEQDCEILRACTLKEVVSILNREELNCIILDYMLPDANGLEILHELKQKWDSEVPVLFITGYGEEFLATKAIAAGATNYFPKDKIKTESHVFLECFRHSLDLVKIDLSRIRAKCCEIKNRLLSL